MFGERYHKELERLLPFLEQSEDLQTLRELNENDEESEECVTPNYNAIEEDDEKIVKNDHENSSNNGPYEDISCSNDRSNYQQMRENLSLDYETFFNRNFFTNNQNVEENEATSIIINESKNHVEKYDFGEFDSSFRNLIDSDYHRSDAPKEKEKILKNQETSTKVNKSAQCINSKDLIKAMLSKDPEVRKKIMLQFLSEEKSKIQMKSCDKNTNKKSEIDLANEEKENLEKTEVDKVVECEKELYPNDSKNNMETMRGGNSSIFECEKDIETPGENLFNRRKEEFENESFQRVYEFEKIVKKNIRAENLEFVRTKRILLSEIEKNYKKLITRSENVKNRVTRLQEKCDEDLESIKVEANNKFSEIEQQISKLENKINAQNDKLEEEIENLTNEVLKKFYEEMDEAKENENLLLCMLDDLLSKI